MFNRKTLAKIIVPVFLIILLIISLGGCSEMEGQSEFNQLKSNVDKIKDMSKKAASYHRENKLYDLIDLFEQTKSYVAENKELSNQINDMLSNKPGKKEQALLQKANSLHEESRIYVGVINKAYAYLWEDLKEKTTQNTSFAGVHIVNRHFDGGKNITSSVNWSRFQFDPENKQIHVVFTTRWNGFFFNSNQYYFSGMLVLNYTRKNTTIKSFDFLDVSPNLLAYGILRESASNYLEKELQKSIDKNK